MNEQVFQAILLSLANIWGGSAALNAFLNAHPLRIAVSAEHLETLARYKGTRETPKPEILFSPEFMKLYYKRQSPNWGPPERVIIHEFRHLFQDAADFLQNSTPTSVSILSGSTTLGILMRIHTSRRNIGENSVTADDDTEKAAQLIEKGFWGGAIGLGAGFATAMLLQPNELDADIASTAAVTERRVANFYGSFFSYLAE